MDTNISIIYAEHAKPLLGVFNTNWNVYKSGIRIGRIWKKIFRKGHLLLHDKEYTFDGMGVHSGGEKLISMKGTFSWRRLSGRTVFQDVANGIDYFMYPSNGILGGKNCLTRSDGAVVAEFDNSRGLLYEAVVFDDLPDYLICFAGWIEAYSE